MIGFALWLSLLGGALLIFYRQPRASGVLFILLGVWSIVLRPTTTANGRAVPLIVAIGTGAVWFFTGIRQLTVRLKADTTEAR